MAKSSVTKLFNEGPLREIERRAHHIQNEVYQELSYAAGGLKAIGNILFGHASGGVQGLNEEDVQGLALTVESLGRHLELLSGKLEDESSDILHRLKEVPGAV